MRQDLGMRLLMEVMNWSDAETADELKAIDRLARYKYDEYSDFLAGAHFVENLAKWLQQFDESDRQCAYDFIRNRLVFISAAEVSRLVETFFPGTIYYHILREIGSREDTSEFEILRADGGQRLVSEAIRKTLFVGLSDGARLDVFRRSNVGRIKNDQVLLTSEVDDARWRAAHDELQKDIGGALFERIYLIDDFAASGTTLCRYQDEKWKGKLPRFFGSVQEYFGNVIAEGAPIHVHHFIGTSEAEARMQEREHAIRASGEPWFTGPIKFSFGLVLRREVILDEDADSDFLALCDAYYDSSIESIHGDAAGERCLKRGYARCQLPVIMHHNTPNNSVALLWAESEGGSGTKMTPLFRRRQRHS